MSDSEFDEKINSLITTLQELKLEKDTPLQISSKEDKVKQLQKKIDLLSAENSRLRSYITALESRTDSLPMPIRNEIKDIARFSNSSRKLISVVNAEDEMGKSGHTSDKRNEGDYDKTPFSLKTCSFDSCSTTPYGKYIWSSATTLSVVKLCWKTGYQPRRVLIIKKKDNEEASVVLRTMIVWLKKRGVAALVEPTVQMELRKQGLADIQTWRPEEANHLHRLVDFVITLGGDGTLLFASALFHAAIPPVLSFHMGTLGFLTPFSAIEFAEPLNRMLEGDVPLTMRSRLECSILRGGASETSDASDADEAEDVFEAKLDVPKILNDVVISRGTSNSMVELHCYVNSMYITTVHADGLIIATPTGSTAYSLSAGGSMVHPLTPGLLMTPICPHTLSFRQMLFPDSIVLRVEVSRDSRSSASISFDGQSNEHLAQGDAIVIRVSKYPLCSVSPDDNNNNWFRSVRDGLHWNKATSPIVDANSFMDSLCVCFIREAESDITADSSNITAFNAFTTLRHL